MIMTKIGEWVSNLYDWAFSETNKVKAFMKAFIAGFVDGWLYNSLVWGNVLLILSMIFSITKRNRRID